MTDLLFPLGYRIDPDLPADPADLIQRFVYVKSSGRRSLDWFLAKVCCLAKAADSYIGSVMALTHQVEYLQAKPRGASTSGRELVDLGRREHGQTWYLLLKNPQ